MGDGDASRRSAADPVVAVCLNPAWDITYRVAALHLGESHTASVVAERAGGKGTNVARILHQLGRPVHLVGLRGGAQGDLLQADLHDAGISCAFAPIGQPTRRSVTVVEGNDATVLNEAGPVITHSEWDAFLDLFGERVGSASAVSISGSLPPGLPLAAYAQLTQLANEAGVPVVLDAAGQPFSLGVNARPAIAAPNRAEVSHTFGWELPDRRAVVRAAQRICELGARAVVISSGAEGLVAHDGGRAWSVKPPWLVPGNPTGAGDALTAALADGLAAGTDWPTILRHCTAWSAAAVATPWAGELDEKVMGEVLDATHVEEI